MAESSTLPYQRATFVTRLPVAYLYTASHGWLARAGERRWRVGYTKFALRLLGELVDVQIDRAPGAAVQPGDILGCVEGFKAVSDVFCAGRGRFVGGNPGLQDDLDLVQRDVYGAWLDEFEGEPEGGCRDVEAYRALTGRRPWRLGEAATVRRSGRAAEHEVC